MNAWPVYFKTQDHHIDYQTENKPFVKSRAELVAQLPVRPGDNVNTVTVTDDVERFANGDDADEFSSEADGLIHFCSASAVKSSRTDQAPNSLHVALVDDRSCVGGETRSRPYQGPLTSDGLYEWLARPRFRHRKFVLSENVDTSTPPNSRGKALKPWLRLGRSSEKDTSCASSAPPVQSSTAAPKSDNTEDESEEPDADRRVIFVTDLDSSTARALISTVSSNQAPALRDALYRHLAADSFMGVSISPRGLPMFRLSFHLPFFSLRSSLAPRIDHRSRVRGIPLRDATDVSFLDWHDQGTRGPVYLYEAHVTCVVAGFHDWCWIAYCFVDTYYEDHENRESVDDYDDHVKNSQGMASDAPTLGNLEADKPIWDPREYFLHVIYFRLLQAKSEWQSTIKQIVESFRRYERSHYHSLSQQSVRRHPGELGSVRRTPKQDLNLTILFLKLFTDLDECLSRNIDAYEAFCSKSTGFFVEFQQSAPGNASLIAIDTIFNELKSLKKTIKYMETRGDRIRSALELRLNLEALENSQGQSRMVRYVTPIALTTGVFSMQKMVIPLVQPNLVWFLTILGIFSLMAFGVHILSIIRRQLPITSKVIEKVCSVRVDVSHLLRRKQNHMIDDVENGRQSSTICTSDRMRLNDVLKSRDDQQHKPDELRSATSSGINTPPNTHAASHHHTGVITPRGSNLIQRQGTLASGGNV